mmetsp:Transcript_31392/g.96978  ORF Transcript_31392/g.96978 Transcript_31392/m.96978 type:complete len:223 (+) Transcript_31392:1250-1918(+)
MSCLIATSPYDLGCADDPRRGCCCCCCSVETTAASSSSCGCCCCGGGVFRRCAARASPLPTTELVQSEGSEPSAGPSDPSTIAPAATSARAADACRCSCCSGDTCALPMDTAAGPAALRALSLLEVPVVAGASWTMSELYCPDRVVACRERLCSGSSPSASATASSSTAALHTAAYAPRPATPTMRYSRGCENLNVLPQAMLLPGGRDGGAAFRVAPLSTSI